MLNGQWREETLITLEQLLKTNENVISFSMFGSMSNTEVLKDQWSDIDALIVVKDEAISLFFPTMHWLKPLGEILTYQQSDEGNRCTTKVIFTDFRKIDFVITTESVVIHGFDRLTKQKIIFSKNPEITKLLSEAPLSITDSSIYPFEKMVNDYWYISFVAVTKLMRNDLLISLHLALELYKRCLELGMWLRDRETGTNVHRTGGVRNDLVETMQIRVTGTSKKDILRLIEECGKAFDALAGEWSSEYIEHFSTFQRIIELAKQELS